MKCDFCGRRNHLKRDCYFYKKQSDNIKSIATTQVVTNADGFAFMLGNAKMPEPVSKNKVQFLLDSGATDHIINNCELFDKMIELSLPLQIAVAKTGASISATKMGVLNLITNLGIPGKLENVLYSYEVPYNLLSVSRIQESGMEVIFDKKGVKKKK